MVNQERPDHGNVVNLTNSYAVEDNAHSSSPLCLEFCSGNTNSRALISSSLSQETTNNVQKEVKEQLRNLKEELAKIRDENISLRSERAKWEALTRNSIDRFNSFRKDNEHQLFILKHENELISNAEKQARQMVNSLSQRLHCLKIAVESGVEERRKQEEYIHMLQNECTKARIELQERNKCIESLTLKLDKNTHIPVRITEEARQKFVNAFSEIAAAESNAAGAQVGESIKWKTTLTAYIISDFVLVKYLMLPTRLLNKVGSSFSPPSNFGHFKLPSMGGYIENHLKHDFIYLNLDRR
ncbi:Nuclear-pore anchor, partial [Mucuna pruriens]